MNISTPNYSQNFCACGKAGNLCGVSVRIAPQITRLTAIANLEIEGNKTVAYTRNGDILSTNYDCIITSLREVMTELAWTHKYNKARGTRTRR